MSITTHEQLIRETAAALITEYKQGGIRSPVEDHVAHGLRERIGEIDAAEQRIVGQMIARAFAPRAWDGEGWREPRSTGRRRACGCSGCLSGASCIDPYHAGGV